MKTAFVSLRNWLNEVPHSFSVQSVAYPEAWLHTNWLTFLQQREASADSLSILDDLVSIIEG